MPTSRRCRPRLRLALRVSACAGLVLAAAGAGAAETDPRSHEVLVYDCGSQVGRRQMTLFGNGTIRIRTGPRGEEQMLLGELGDAELRAYLNRLEEVDLSEAESPSTGATGDWVDVCDLVLRLTGDEERSFRFGRFDSLSLGLSRIVRIAEELAEEGERQGRRAGIPGDYAPRPGDLLRRADGVLFEVVGDTGDGRGIELVGVDQPLVVYILRDSLADEFVALVEKTERPEP